MVVIMKGVFLLAFVVVDAMGQRQTTEATADNLCPTGVAPLKDEVSGVALFCGRGPDSVTCPDGSTCYIDPADRFAVCCQDANMPVMDGNHDMDMDYTMNDMDHTMDHAGHTMDHAGHTMDHAGHTMDHMDHTMDHAGHTMDHMDHTMDPHGDHGHDTGDMDHDSGHGDVIHDIYFQYGNDAIIIFKEWVTYDSRTMRIACVLTALAAILYEGLKVGREQLLQKEKKYKSNRARLYVFGRKNATCCQSCCSPSSPACFALHFLQTIFHACVVFLGYSLMMVFMTLNVWLVVGLISGHAIGYLAFGWLRPATMAMSDLSDHCAS